MLSFVPSFEDEQIRQRRVGMDCGLARISDALFEPQVDEAVGKTRHSTAVEGFKIKLCSFGIFERS